jgi:ubiquinone/menaquinone biosynthesis C-methylase UbiE
MLLATDDITQLKSKAPDNTVFEEEYLKLRKKENRIYSDELVSSLPLVPEDHPHAAEWKMRAQSCERLIGYLGNKNKFLKILEVGCGNGWLSHLLSMLPGNVTGCDINQEELEQAARIFSTDRIRFSKRDQLCNENDIYDVIVFAASMQYFESFKETIDKFSPFLNKDGEIHVLDTHFYNKKDIETARQRTKEYFRQMNSDEMTKHYFHHSIEELKQFDHEFLYNPSFSFLKNKNNPFPWICIYPRK